jgi:hypothetical protein
MTRRLALFFLPLLLLSACATHRVAPVPEVITAPPPGHAKLIVPADVTPISLDGGAIGFPETMRWGELELTITAGAHTLIAQYAKVWDIDQARSKFMTSAPVPVALRLEDGGIYRLAFREPRTTAEAERFTENPLFTMEAITPGSELPAVPRPSPSAAPSTAPAASAPVMLRQWWTAATVKERREFLEWAISK